MKHAHETTNRTVQYLGAGMIFVAFALTIGLGVAHFVGNTAGALVSLYVLGMLTYGAGVESTPDDA